MEVVVNARFLTQPITGTQRFAIELCKELKKLIPKLQFVSPPNIIHHDVAEELGVITFGRINQNLIWEQIELPLYLIRNGSPLLVNLCNSAPILYTRNIVSILDLSFHIHPQWFAKSFVLLYNIMIPYCAKRAKKILTISENSKNDINKYFKIPNSQIEIIYPSISESFRYNERAIKQSDDKFILGVSSLDPRKNFDGLIKAFKEANFPDAKLVIVGQQHRVFANTGLKELIENDNRIVFTGYLSDDKLAELYRNATLFAYPSFFEGFGIPPLEAMAAGCPTLVSSTTSMPEVCGDASLYVDPNSIESIKNGLIRAMSDADLRSDLRRKGYIQVKKYNWGDSARKLANILTKLIGNGK